MREIALLIELTKKLTEFSKGTYDLWSLLAYQGQHGRLFWKGLQQTIEQANNANAQALISLNISECEAGLDDKESFLNSVEKFYNFKGYINHGKQYNFTRLHTNSKGLIASAKSALLALRTSQTSETLIQLAEQVCQTAIILGEKVGDTDLVKAQTSTSWISLDPLSLLEQLFNSLANCGFAMLAARYWILYWLGQNTTLYQRSRKATIIGYQFGSAKLNSLNLLLLNSKTEIKLIENPKRCLLALDEALIDGINRSWERTNIRNGYRSVCWEFEPANEHTSECGDSLSGMVEASLDSLYRDTVYDSKSLVLAINKGQEDELIPVGFEREKLTAAVKAKIEFVAIVENQKLADKEDANTKSNRLTETEIANFQQHGLKIRYIKTILEAIDFVTIKPCPLYNVPDLSEHFLSRREIINGIKAALLANQSLTVGLIGSAKVGLQGMGGIGKTFLAKEFAHSADPEVWKAFPDGIIWATIGQDIGKDIILRQADIIEALTKEQPVLKDVIDGTNKLRKALENKACLLILDDIWAREQYEAFNVLSKNSRMLITTRDAELLNIAGATTQSIEQLDKLDAIKMLADYAGKKVDELPDEAHTIAIKWCRCLPFGLGLFGSLVKDAGLKWKDILKSLEQADLKSLESQFGNIDQLIANNSVQALGDKAIYYQRLAAFREDAKIPDISIATLLSYTDKLAEHQVNSLIALFLNRGLLLKSQDNTYEIHDLLYLCLLNKANSNRKSLSNILLEAYKAKYKKWDSATTDPYFVKNAAYHFKEAERDEEFRELLLNFNYIQAKLNSSDITSLLADYYLDDQDTNIIKKTIALSTYALKKDKNQLAAQIIGRLNPNKLTNEPGLIDSLANMVNKAKSLFTRLNKTNIINKNNSNKINNLLNQATRFDNSVWLEPLTQCLTSAKTSLIATLEGHSSNVNAVAIIGNGQEAISAGDSTFRIWNLETQECVAIFEDYFVATGSSGAEWFSDDGKIVISGTWQGELRVWDLEKRKFTVLEGHSDRVGIIIGPRSGKTVISGSSDGTIRVWDLESKKCTTIFEGYPRNIYSALAATRDGKTIISSSLDGMLKVWDLDSKRSVAILEGHPVGARVLTIGSDDNTVIASCLDNTVRVWDLESRKCVAILKGHSWSIRALAITSDNKKFISGSADKTLKVWDLESKRCIATLEGHSATIYAIAISKDNKKIISASGDKTLKIWDLENENGSPVVKGHSDKVNSVAITKDNKKIISASEDKTLKIWDLEKNACIGTLEGHSASVNAITLTLDGKRAFSTSFQTLKIWDLEKQRCIATLQGGAFGGQAVAVTKDGKIFITGSANKDLKVWDSERRCCIATLTGHSHLIRAVAFICDDRKAISVGLGPELKVWDLDKQTSVATLMRCENSIGSDALAAIEDGKKVISSFGYIQVWDLESQESIVTLDNYRSSVNSIVVNEKLRIFISASDDKTLKVWDLDTYQEVGCFYGEQPFTCCAVDDNGLIVAGDKLGQLYIFKFKEK